MRRFFGIVLASHIAKTRWVTISEMFAALSLEKPNGERLATTSGVQGQWRPLSVAEQPRLCPTLWETP